MFTDAQVSKFWSNVNKASEKECWNWKLSTDRYGYGKAKIGGLFYSSHRAAYEIGNGEINQLLFVLHSCDNPICCNPLHLFQGTHLENMKDKVKRNRSAKIYTPTKLDQEKANEIRRLFLKEKKSKHELSRLYQVSPQAIRDVIARRFWNHDITPGVLNHDRTTLQPR